MPTLPGLSAISPEPLPIPRLPLAATVQTHNTNTSPGDTALINSIHREQQRSQRETLFRPLCPGSLISRPVIYNFQEDFISVPQTGCTATSSSALGPLKFSHLEFPHLSCAEYLYKCKSRTSENLASFSECPPPALYSVFLSLSENP